MPVILCNCPSALPDGTADGQIPVWDAATGTWVAETPNDPDCCPPDGTTTGDILVWDGSQWVAQEAPSGGDGLLLPTVTGLDFGLITGSTVELQWDAVPDVWVVIERQQNSIPGVWTQIAALSGVSTYVDSGLTPSTEYSWRFATRFAGSQGAWSYSGSVTTLAFGFDGAITANGSGQTTVDVSSIADGSLMVACVAAYEGAGTYTITPPAGWTEVSSSNPNAHRLTCRCYWRIKQPGETLFTWSYNYISEIICSVVAHSGAAVNNTSSRQGDSATPIGNTINCQDGDTLLFLVAAASNPAPTITAQPTDMTQRANHATTYLRVAMYTGTVSAGSTGNRTVPLSSYDSGWGWHTFMIQVTPG